MQPALNESPIQMDLALHFHSMKIQIQLLLSVKVIEQAFLYSK